MSGHNTEDGYSSKHGSEAVVKEEIKDAVGRAARNGHLPCAVAFAVAQECQCPPAEVGKAADLLELRLVKCQLGLFGYEPESKIVVAQDPDPALRKAIENASSQGRVSCSALWAIAKDLGLGKRQVSGACETMEIRIKPCQLGAF